MTFEMRSGGLRWVMALGLPALAGCSFDAENPGAITEPGLETPGAVSALVSGVVGDYDFAFSRSALYSGLIADELRASGPYSTWRAADLEGKIDPHATASGIADLPGEWWSRLQVARALAVDAYGRVPGAVPEAQQKPLQALTRLYSGMAYRDIGEYFCEASYDAGPRVSREKSLETARQHLTEAIELASAAGVDSVAQMASLIRAQVHLSLGNSAEALADVRRVPAGFRWFAHYRQGAHESNQLATYLNEQAIATVQPDFWSTGDPRVPGRANGKAMDGVTPRWDQSKYGKYDNVPMGSWQEARLIEAEILIDGGQIAPAVALLNQVRAAAGLPALSAGLSKPDAVQALRLERKHELFLQGERMLDMRRWQLYPAGFQSCVPIPASELKANPNL